MKKIAFYLFAWLLPMTTVHAVTVEIDGIWYNIITKTNTAEVTRNPSLASYLGSYSGSVSIPAKITYNGAEYPVTKIGEQSFYRCGDLTSIIIPNSVTTIGNSAFSDCRGLTSLNIPTSVTTIDNFAFQYCSGLITIDIPNSVTTIGQNVFDACSSLTSVNISNSVTSISFSAFFGCNSLTLVNIPNSVTTISSDAFYGCSSLTSITIPNSVTNIGASAFYGCSSLTSVTISNSLTTIGSNAFHGCGLNTITIPGSVKTIEDKAFSDCIDLIDVYCYHKEVTNISYSNTGLYTYANAFDGSYPESITLHVPSESIDAYKALEPWSHFKEIVALSADGTDVLPDDEEPTGPKKCAIPQIKYADGKLQFSCETSGASFVYSITNADIKSGDGNEVQLGLTFKVSVYAKKDGYENSDVSTREIIVTGLGKAVTGDINLDGKVNAADIVMVTNLIMNK